MKTAQQAAEKFASRASAASGDYGKGARETTKDQASLAIAAADIHKAATMEALNAGRYAKGLQKSGKQGWLNGITSKGENRYSEGVMVAGPKYAANSAPYDSARNAAAGMPRGMKGSAANLNRVKAVMDALRAAKVGK